MNYAQFKNSVLDSPLILSKNISMFKKNKQVIRNQFRRWQEKGLIIKLKKGIYILNANDRKINPGRQFIANQLYTPSYVSLEFALNFYGFIPERVAEITSVTTKKTVTFTNKLGIFVYQHIKPKAFRGFRMVEDENGLRVFIAEPEKAIVDFLYLNLNRFKNADKDIFKNSYRFQNTESLSQKKIIELSGLFGSDALNRACRLFCEYLKTEKKQ